MQYQCMGAEACVCEEQNTAELIIFSSKETCTPHIVNSIVFMKLVFTHNRTIPGVSILVSCSRMLLWQLSNPIYPHYLCNSEA